MTPKGSNTNNTIHFYKHLTPLGFKQKHQHDCIVNCVTQLLAAKQKIIQAKEGRDKDFITNQCNALDTQIDNLVYELYGLNDEEIKIVESW